MRVVSSSRFFDHEICSPTRQMEAFACVSRKITSACLRNTPVTRLAPMI